MSYPNTHSDDTLGTQSDTRDDSAGTATEDGCTLCSFPTPATPHTAPDVDGEFCCQGCIQVQRTLGDVDDISAETVRDRLDDRAESLDDIAGEDAYLAVDGMHCATCEAFLETQATKTAGVVGAAASYATDTVRLRYDPETIEPDDLPAVVSGYGYEARDRAEGRTEEPRDAALIKFLVGGGMFGMMVMIWYAVFLYPTYFGYEPVADFGGYDGYYVTTNIWLMTSFVLFYTGYPVLRGAYVSLKAGMPNMDLLIAVAAVGSYAYSTLAMGLGRTDLYFDVTVAIILAVAAGNYYEDRIKRRATGLLSELTEQQVDEARREGGETVPIDEIEPGDRLLVRPGERVPLDGELVDGTAAIDESLVTGESLPVETEPGDAVRGGTVVTDAPIVVAVGEDAASTLDHLVSMLWSIQSSRPGVQRIADKLATIFVPLVLLLAGTVTAILLATGSPLSTALLVGLTVIIVSCPCALGLATPLAIASGIQSAAKRQVVVATETIFEDAPDVDVVVLDKTGTLTTGSMTVADVQTDPDADVDDETLLARAGAVEALSEHPIGAAIADAVPETAASVAADVDSYERDSRGVSAVLDGTSDRVIVGHPDYLREQGSVVPETLAAHIDRARSAGDVPVVVGWDGQARGVVVVGDAPREEWLEAVETLAEGREIVVLTGDEGAAADRFRAVDAVDEVFAGVPPEAKAETVRRLRSRGTVAMVGDGSNDAPALAAADVGIAMGSGTKLATEAADAVIVGDDLGAVAETFDVAAGTHRRIRQNLGWAFAYNAVAIPLAITGLLNPLFAAVAMAGSSALVVINSARSV